MNVDNALYILVVIVILLILLRVFGLI